MIHSAQHIYKDRLKCCWQELVYSVRIISLCNLLLQKVGSLLFPFQKTLSFLKQILILNIKQTNKLFPNSTDSLEPQRIHFTSFSEYNCQYHSYLVFLFTGASIFFCFQAVCPEEWMLPKNSLNEHLEWRKPWVWWLNVLSYIWERCFRGTLLVDTGERP